MNFVRIIKFIQTLYANQSEIALHAPYFGGNEKLYLENCIDSTFVSSVGEYVNKLEQNIAEYINVKYAVAVSNGTAGLQVGLRLVGVKENDEVLTQALTFIATANAIKYNNADPIFIDVDLDTMGMSPTSLLQFLEENCELTAEGTINKKTKKRISACIPMHTFGFPCRIDVISKICKQWKIPLIEDAAEALGSEYKNKKIGSFGDLAIFSFNGNKIITGGGGGIIVTNNDAFAKKGRHLTTTAKVAHPFDFIHDDIGYNYRMPNINAALLLAQLEQLPKFIDNKRKLALKYNHFFSSFSEIEFHVENDDSKANYWLNCIKFKTKKIKNDFLVESNENKIMCRPIWTLMFKLPMYKSCQRDSQKNAIYLAERIVNIPSSFRNIE
jgi:perosamine synthetase